MNQAFALQTRLLATFSPEKARKDLWAPIGLAFAHPSRLCGDPGHGRRVICRVRPLDGVADDTKWTRITVGRQRPTGRRRRGCRASRKRPWSTESGRCLEVPDDAEMAGQRRHSEQFRYFSVPLPPIYGNLCQCI